MPSSAAIHEADATATENDPLVSALEPLMERFRASRERAESLRLFRAVRLAPTLEVCEALLRGEKVHPSQLDRRYVEAYLR